MEKLLNNSIQRHELQQLRQLAENADNDAALDKIIEAVLLQNRYETVYEVDKDALLKQIKQNAEFKPVPVSTARRVHLLKTAWFRYAAVILLLLGAGAYLWTTNSKKQTSSAVTLAKADVSPGGDKATLTLADGSKIILDNAANGNLADQGGVQVVKLANGQIAYDLKGLSNKEMMWNTMSTPRGGQYQVILPDGTRVWLNAASSITFPTAFTGNERKVKIDGEVYFEVAQNRQKPFLVDIHGESLIEVLGTSFNVNSYENENAIRTTLVEGSVKVSKGSESRILKPGQQAVATTFERQFKIVNAPIDQTLAWKNGLFNFEGSDLYAVMRELERWYDLKVQYQGIIEKVEFKGEMYRNVPLSYVLEMLKGMGVKFKSDGKTLIIL